MININVKEIRLGNWAEDDDISHERFKVEDIVLGKDHTKGMYFINGRWTDDLLPILVTHEILKKSWF